MAVDERGWNFDDPDMAWLSLESTIEDLGPYHTSHNRRI